MRNNRFNPIDDAITLPNLVLSQPKTSSSEIYKIVLVGASESARDSFAKQLSWQSQKLHPQNNPIGINFLSFKLDDGQKVEFWNLPGKPQFQVQSLLSMYWSNTDAVFFFGSHPSEFFASFLQQQAAKGFESQVVGRNSELKPFAVENWSQLPKELVVKPSEFNLEKLLSQLVPDQKFVVKKRM